MSYSFIKPKKKPILNLFAKIWILFFFLCAGIIFSVYTFASTRLAMMNAQIALKQQEAINYQAKIVEYNELFVLFTQRKDLALQIVGERGKNDLIDALIKNILTSITQTKIQLESMFFSKSSLELRGITPTKAMFSLHIQTKLKSIFDETYTAFYPIEGGKFKFISISKTNYEEAQNER